MSFPPQEPRRDNRFTLRKGPDLKEGLSPSGEITWVPCDAKDSLDLEGGRKKEKDAEWQEYKDSYLYSYASRTKYDDLKAAKEACLANDQCNGITLVGFNLLFNFGPLIRGAISFVIAPQNSTKLLNTPP